MLRKIALLFPLAALSVVPVPAQTVSYPSVTGADHQVHADNLSAAGYRMISLSIHGTPAAPRYAAVWVQRPGPNWNAFHGLDAAQYQSYANTWCAQGYTPKLLTATGTLGNERFAGVFDKTEEDCRMFVDLSEAEMRDEIRAASGDGMQIVTMDVYGDATDPRYIVSFGPKTDGLGFEISTSVPDLQTDVDAYASGHARPSLVVSNDHDRFAALWRSDDVGDWVMHHNMNPVAYANFAFQYEQQGMYPISLHASGSGAGTRYAAVWAYTDQPLTPAWQVTGQAVPELAMFDTWARDFMTASETRSANLAIVKDGRLVYARAYTLANPDYRTTQPTDVYRVASCSKPITSIAIHQHYALAGPVLTPSDAMTTFMPNTIAIDGWVSEIKIDHLLTHMPGWIPDYTRGLEAAVTSALGVTLPLTKRNTYDYVTQNRFLDYYPGQGAGYCNLGFNILGQIIEDLNPGFSYAQYVTYNIFAPLGITRGRLGGSLKSEIPATEVFYHPYNPSISNSPVDPSQPLVPAQYGELNIPNRDAQGGWVMAAADYAKILSAFDLPNSPILDATQTDNMWTLAPGAEATMRGWTLGSATDKNGQPVDLYGHNGRLIGSRSLIVRRADGLSFVWLTNGDKVRTSVGLHGGELSDLANTVTVWPNHDLFPSLGLPSHVAYTQGTANSFGGGCAGSNGLVKLHVHDAPDLGQPVDFQITGAPANAPSLLLLGFQNPNANLAPLGAPGCWGYCDPVLLMGSTASPLGLGAFFNWQVPDVPAAHGAYILAQGAVADPPANAFGVTTTNGFVLQLGGWQ